MKYGYTPLMIACMFSNIKIVELLICDGNINVVDYYHNNILNLSCSHGNENYEIIEFFIKKGMDVDSYNDFLIGLLL